MSRRQNPAADRAAQNTATLKSLVKLEGNKSCADCKRNKHPRWASWNLGIFICIRCSGIHRGMGTHISRVKSVDLDSWTDEQLQSMLRWGNARANKYWEAKLAPGHIPSETKIENFIRTKYDSKRWVMDGPMPDPATLDVDGDDDVPLNVVKEKAQLDRSSSTRNGTASQPPRTAARAPAPTIDLFGDEPSAQPARPSTVEPGAGSRPQPPQKVPAAPPKQTKPGDSLLGLDFFGGAQTAAPPRPSSAASGLTSPGVPQRSDLKQSILSLYSSAPRAAPPPQTASNSFGGLASPPLQSPSQSSFGGLNDAFSSLNFSSNTSTPAPQVQQAPKPAVFSSLTSPTVSSRQPSVSSSTFGSGGGFFDSKPAPVPKTSPPPPPKPNAQNIASSFDVDDSFGDFTSSTPAKSPAPATTSTMGDLFGMTSPTPRSPPKPASKPVESTYSYTASSAFNLSTPIQPPQPKPAPTQTSSAFSGLSNMDAWGSNDAWGTPDPAPAPAVQTSTHKSPPTTSLQSDFGGWGSNTAAPAKPEPTVTQDDDFGGWSSASPVATTTTTAPQGSKTGGFGGSDDLFGNVWE